MAMVCPYLAHHDGVNGVVVVAPLLAIFSTLLITSLLPQMDHLNFPFWLVLACVPEVERRSFHISLSIVYGLLPTMSGLAESCEGGGTGTEYGAC